MEMLTDYHPRSRTPFPTGFMGQSELPILSAVQAYEERGTVAFSTRGHNGGSSFDIDMHGLPGKSVFEAGIWLNARDQDDAVQRAEELAAIAWGAERAWFLVNGSSSGNQALLLAQLEPGDEVIVGRDAHRSVIDGLIATGAVPVFVSPRLHPDLDIGTGIHEADIASALSDHPQAKLVVVTNPNYHGIASDIRAICRVAHERDVPVYVDQAGGAHLRFHPTLPDSAMDAGADAAVISVHKTLSSLSQGSILLVQGDRINRPRLAATVRMSQPTSHSLPILASLDAARRQVAMHGWALMELTLALAAQARAKLRQIPGVDVIDGARLRLEDHRFDTTRLVIDTRCMGLDGMTVERLLRDSFGIAPEMSDPMGIVCLVTNSDTRESIDRLVDALWSIARDMTGSAAGTTAESRRSVGQAIAPGEMVMSPREAYFSESRLVPLPAAIGEIAAEMVVPYPPGIPVLVPGERIGWDKLMYLAEISAKGARCPGTADPTLLRLQVVGPEKLVQL